MSLPPNYYDFVKKIRPIVVELAEKDAFDLLASSNPPVSIHSVDDYSSRFAECIDKIDDGILEGAAKYAGISLESLKNQAGFNEAKKQVKTEFASLYLSVNNEYHSLVNFALAGKKSFYFSDNLTEHLANTEINMKANLIELPFQTCMFTYTSKAAINVMHNIRGYDGRWDMNTNGLDYSAPVSVFLTLHPAGAGLAGKKLLIVATHAKLPNKHYLMLKRELYLGEDWNLEQALRTDWETLTPNDLGIAMRIDVEAQTIEHQDDDTFYTDGLAFYRLILNSILYLSSDHAELSNKTSPHAEIEAKAKQIASLPKRRKALQAISKFSTLDYSEVGASVGSIVVKHESTENNQSSTGTIGNKPTVRFMVRGHWRQQPHGVGNMQRKIIWIRPHFKGADVATLINKPYIVK